jgi:hypothetical protein
MVQREQRCGFLEHVYIKLYTAKLAVATPLLGLFCHFSQEKKTFKKIFNSKHSF